MRKKVKKKYNYRFVCLLGIFAVAFFGILFQLATLQVVDSEFLKQQGDARTIRVVEIPAYRGVINDRNGEPLAVSTLVESVWVNPKKVDVSDKNIATLAKMLDRKASWLKNKVNAAQDKEFIYLKRHVSPKLAQEIKALKVAGVYSKPEYRRYYPAGEVTAHVLGFTNIDDNGQEGLELKYQGYLKGTKGQKKIVKDRMGREVEYLANIREQQKGKDLTLSLDQRLQYLSYKALKSTMQKHQAKSGSVVVLDVDTSEVLSMTNLPSFNPNNRSKGDSPGARRNRAVTDYFEPASAIKAFSLTSVLENSPVTSHTLVDTSPGYMKLKGGVVKDLRNNGIIDVTTILRRSSNIGITKLVLDMPGEKLWSTYDRLGFGEATGSGFPGESKGTLSLPDSDKPFGLATMSFGYGVAVTPLQLAKAYAILGSGGVSRPISFIKSDMPLPGMQVISPSVARRVVEMLAVAVEQGNSKAMVNGYHIAGKTGTARMLGEEGYEARRHRAVFGGLVPAINPRFAIVVTIDEPSAGQYYSSQVAAPLFSQIASGALRLFKVQPDVIDTQGVYVAQNGANHS